MPFQPIFTSLLETDLYKFSMLQALLHAYPANQAEYRFMCRNQPEHPLSELVGEVQQQIEHLCSLRFTDDELAYLRTQRYLKSDFLDYLSLFQLQRRFIEIKAVGDELSIVAKGPQIHVMLFEIFVLAIVNELYFRRYASEAVFAEGRARLMAKMGRLQQAEAQGELQRRHPFEFFDFGLRRRFSGAWHEEVLRTLRDTLPRYFKGTSNVALARKLGLFPIGTMAHEYMQTFQAVGVQLKLSQKAALEAWVQEYRGDLGVALTDVVGMDAFINDFDLYFAKLFDGLRHDSGDPVVWGEKALAHYVKLRVDAHSKRLVFSDGLSIDSAISLYSHFADRASTGFGIGTFLTNDLGPAPLNIVMKLVSCNHQPVAKLSDSPGKTMCSDETFLAYLRQVFQVKA